MKRYRFDPALIAPCGINCGICRAHLRPRNPCLGCNNDTHEKSRVRSRCLMRLCDKRKGRFCGRCGDYPCDRLAHLDRRYRTCYGMSEIENLNYIRDHGLKKFLEAESRRWIFEEGILCVHDRMFYAIDGDE
jgi:hypothetical protein